MKSKPVNSVGVGKEQRRYEVEDAMRVLTRAEQIRKDPKLMADVRTLASDLRRVVGRAPANK